MQYLNYEEKMNKLFAILSVNLRAQAKNNTLSAVVLAENVYMKLLNRINDWNLTNINKNKSNVAGIDLIDETNKIILQFSIDASKNKLDHSLKYIDYYKDQGYRFIFVTLDKGRLHLSKYDVPTGIKFQPESDIIDNAAIVSLFSQLSIDKQEDISAEFQREIDTDHFNRISLYFDSLAYLLGKTLLYPKYLADIRIRNVQWIVYSMFMLFIVLIILSCSLNYIFQARLLPEYDKLYHSINLNSFIFYMSSFASFIFISVIQYIPFKLFANANISYGKFLFVNIVTLTMLVFFWILFFLAYIKQIETNQIFWWVLLIIYFIVTFRAFKSISKLKKNFLIVFVVYIIATLLAIEVATILFKVYR